MREFDSLTLLKMKRYSADYDAYYEDSTDSWLENQCKNPKCDYCANRPELPSMTKHVAVMGEDSRTKPDLYAEINTLHGILLKMFPRGRMNSSWSAWATEQLTEQEIQLLSQVGVEVQGNCYEVKLDLEVGARKQAPEEED